MSRVVWPLIILTILFRFWSTRVSFPDGVKLRITQQVLMQPYRVSDQQNFQVKNLWVRLPSFPEVSYGDTVTVEGEVSGEDLKNAKLVRVVTTDNYLFSLRGKILEFYQRSLPEPSAGLIGGIVLGAKSSLPPDFNRALKNTGTSHIVVASGMNVTLVAGFLLSFLILFIPRRKAIVLALGGIWVYAVMAGFEAPIVRASIMGSIAYLAQGLGRVNTAWRTLFVAGAGMLLIRPDWLTDVGFLLSFTATASLMLFERRIARVLKRWEGEKYLPGIFKESLTTTLAAQVGVTPILFVTFGQFNPLSPFINALVLWTVPLITILGGVAALTGLLIEPAGKLILYLIYPLTAYFIWVIELFGGI